MIVSFDDWCTWRDWRDWCTWRDRRDLARLMHPVRLMHHIQLFHEPVFVLAQLQLVIGLHG
jgi:hypothetical protein